MAMTAFELFGVLKLDKTEFDRGLDKARSEASGFGSAISKGVSTLGSGLVTAAKVGAAAIGAATTAAVGFGKASVNAASEYESAFTGVRKTVDGTEEDFEQLSDWILEASTRMASTQEEIAGTMEIAGQLGISGVEGLEKFTETMIMLGDTTNLNAEEAASALAKFGNIAGVGATDMNRIGSVIVDLGNHFATTEADIVNMSTRLASAGTIAGLSATDILALSTAMSSVGINAEAGGTAMSTILTKIGRAVDAGIDPANEKLQLFAQTANMSAEAFADAWKSDPTMALQGFVKGLDGVIDEGGNVTAILDDLGIKGIREANTIRSLALASDVLTDSVARADRAFDENIALQNEAALRYDTTESKAIQAANAFKNLRIAVGEELKPIYGEFLSFSQTALESMTKGFEEGGLEGLMSSLGTAISDSLAMLNEYLPDFVQAGIGLISALGQGILDNLDSIIEAGGTILGTLGEAIVNGLPAVVDAGLQILESLLSAFVENMDSIMASVENLITGIGDAISAHGDKIMEMGRTIVETLFNALVKNLPEIMRFATQLISVLAEGLAQALPELIPEAVKMVLTIVEGMLDNIDMIIDAGIKLILALADGLINALPKLIEALPTIIDNLVQALTKLAPKLATVGPELMVKLALGLVQAIPSLVQAVPQIVTSLATALINYAANLIKSGKELVEKVKMGFESLDPAKWGRDLIDKFVQGITGAIGKVKNAVTNVANSIKSIIGFSLPESGPLHDFDTYAPDMMKLFAQGIKDNEDLIALQVTKSFDIGGLITDVKEMPSRDANSGLGRIESLLMDVINNMNQNIYLDTGMLVGGTVALYDNALGTRSNRGGLR